MISLFPSVIPNLYPRVVLRLFLDPSPHPMSTLAPSWRYPLLHPEVILYASVLEVFPDFVLKRIPYASVLEVFPNFVLK